MRGGNRCQSWLLSTFVKPRRSKNSKPNGRNEPYSSPPPLRVPRPSAARRVPAQAGPLAHHCNGGDAKLQIGQPSRAASITATSIFIISIIASNARFVSAPPAAIASVSARGVICQDMPHLCLCTSRRYPPAHYCRRWRSGSGRFQLGRRWRSGTKTPRCV